MKYAFTEIFSLINFTNPVIIESKTLKGAKIKATKLQSKKGSRLELMRGGYVSAVKSRDGRWID